MLTFLFSELERLIIAVTRVILTSPYLYGAMRSGELNCEVVDCHHHPHLLYYRDPDDSIVSGAMIHHCELMNLSSFSGLISQSDR